MTVLVWCIRLDQ